MTPLTAPVTSFLSALVGLPHVIVSPKGYSASGANYSSITNDGAAFGPDTPSTTTSGIAEAIASLPVATPSITNPVPGGGVVFLLATAPFIVSSTIVVPTNVVIVSEMYAGVAYGTKLSQPTSFIQPPGTGTPLVDVIQFPDNSCKNGMIGVALVGNASGALIHRMGARQSFLVDCYADNTYSTGSGVITDAPATGNGVNSEDNTASRCFFRGVKRAIGIGTGDGTQQSNDCTWWDITAEVPSGSANNVVEAVEGGNQQFYNFYSRGGTTGAIFSGPASYKIIGGELANTSAGTTGSSTSAQIASISGGDWLFKDLTLTEGSVTMSGGTLRLVGVKVNTPPGVSPAYSVGPLTVAGGPAFIDRDCDLSGLAKTSTGIVVGLGGEVYLEPQFPLWDPAVVIHTPTTGNVHPSNPAAPSPYAPASASFVGGPPAAYTNTRRNLQMLVMSGGSTISQITLNGGTNVLPTTMPLCLVLRYMDTIAVSIGAGGSLPTAVVWDLS